MAHGYNTTRLALERALKREEKLKEEVRVLKGQAKVFLSVQKYLDTIEDVKKTNTGSAVKSRSKSTRTNNMSK